MPSTSRLTILVAGSQQSDTEQFTIACTEIGRRLGDAGYDLVAGSMEENTVDNWVIRGYQESPSRGTVTIIQRPDRIKEIKADANVNVTVARQDRRSEQIAAANAVLLISGGKGTRSVLDRARKKDLPMLLIPAFEGTAAKFFSEEYERYLGLGLDEKLLHDLQEWNERSASRVIFALQRMLYPDDPGEFLLTWDPKRFEFEGLRQVVEQTETEGEGIFEWSASPWVTAGSRAYLMRHDEDDPGLVGVGTIDQPPEEKEHWDPKKREEGLTTWFAVVRWERLSEQPVVGLEQLIEATGESELWTRYGSGHFIRPELRDTLDQLMTDQATADEVTADEVTADEVTADEEISDPKHGLVSIERLKDFDFSPDVQRIIERAAEEAGRPQGADAAITASLLLIAILQEESEAPTAGTRMRDLLYEGNREAGENTIREYAPFYERQAGPKLATPRTGEYPIGWLSPFTEEFLDHAERYARQTTGNKTIHLRHLVAAIIVRTFHNRSQPPGTVLIFARFETSEAQLKSTLLRWIEGEENLGDDLNVWHSILGDGADLAAVMPRIELESPHGEDLIGIDKDVNALANIIAAQSLEPPLAIGLFGDWGSGKSFFMEQLRGRITFLADHASNRVDHQEQCAFHPRIAQIWFNAWNYVETNLWASLVTHIFESLHRDFVPDDQEEKKQWERLLRRLEKESTLREEARGELQVAENELQEAKQDQRTQKLRVQTAVAAIWSTLKSTDVDGFKEVGKVLNAEELREVRDSLIRNRDEATDLLERLPLFKRTMMRGLTSLKSLGLLAIVFLVAAFVLAAINQWAPDLFKGFAQTVTTIVGVVGAASAWIGSAFKRANGVLITVEKAERTLHDRLAAGTIDDQELSDAEQAMEHASQRVEEHEQEIGALRREINELQPSRRLTGFLANRAESADYRKHLGLPAIIRRDFEHLQKLMDEMDKGTEPFSIDANAMNSTKAGDRASESEQSVPPELLAALQAPERRLFMSPDAQVARSNGRWVVSEPGVDFNVHVSDDGQCRVEWKRLKIDRIVLYIDDLDRCPSDRVVEVLQAIRLLLDFKLFVVVVGVDARWVTQALQSHHGKQWKSDKDEAVGDTNSLSRAHAAEPQDFLEKIFQIPLWLEPLEEEGIKRYLRGLTGLTSDSSADATDVDTAIVLDEDGADENGADVAAGSDNVDDKATVSPQQPRRESVPASDGPRDIEGSGPKSREEENADESSKLETGTPDQEATVTSEIHERDEAEETAAGATKSPHDVPPMEDPGDEVMNPAGLELDPREKKFMLELANIVGRSPRAVKRFVNVYRLIRARIARSELSEFIGSDDEPGAYQAVQFLLAVIVGFPAVSDELFAKLRRGNKSLLDIAKSHVSDNKIAADKRMAWQTIQQFLKPAEGTSAFSTHDKLSSQWLDRVGRFSFRVGRR